MEIVNIEFWPFEQMLARFEGFARRMDAFSYAHRFGESKLWLDNHQLVGHFQPDVANRQGVEGIIVDNDGS